MKKKDIILLAAVLAAAAIAGLILLALRTEDGSCVTVTVDGEIYGTYSLNEDQTVEIQTEYGTNILEIKDGAAAMIEASCPDGYCMDQGSKNKNRQTIVCLPNKVVVEISADEDSDDYDVDAIAN